MVLKFDAVSCLDDRLRNVQPSTSANAIWIVQEEMEIIVGLSTHEEDSALEVAHCTPIPYTTVWAAL